MTSIPVGTSSAEQNWKLVLVTVLESETPEARGYQWDAHTDAIPPVESDQSGDRIVQPAALLYASFAKRLCLHKVLVVALTQTSVGRTLGVGLDAEPHPAAHP